MQYYLTRLHSVRVVAVPRFSALCSRARIEKLICIFVYTRGILDGDDGRKLNFGTLMDLHLLIPEHGFTIFGDNIRTGVRSVGVSVNP